MPRNVWQEHCTKWGSPLNFISVPGLVQGSCYKFICLQNKCCCLTSKESKDEGKFLSLRIYWLLVTFEWKYIILCLCCCRETLHHRRSAGQGCWPVWCGDGHLVRILPESEALQGGARGGGGRGHALCHRGISQGGAFTENWVNDG